MSLELVEQETDNRFFTSEDKEPSGENVQIEHSLIIAGDDDADGEADSDVGDQKCVTLRLLQKCLPWFQKKSVWEPSQGDVFKTEEVEELKYPTILKIVDHPAFDIVYVTSSLLSVFLLLFSEGFILESTVMWGLIHCNNFIYTLCVFGIWLSILIKSKYAKTNQEFSTKDTFYTIISVLPIDIIVLVVHSFSAVQDNSQTSEDDENQNTITGPISEALPLSWMTVCRFMYFFRIRNVFLYFAKWDDQLAFGDFKMFLLLVGRIALYGFFMMHFIACAWHWIACRPFQMQHLMMRPLEATVTLCKEGSWVMKLLHEDSPLLRHGWNVLAEHYFVSMYWGVVTVFRLGASDITASLTSDGEVAFTAITQIMAWIFIVVFVSGSLTSILVERDAEKQNFLTRRFAIERYLDFSNISQDVRNNVNRFYDYLWARSRGIHNWDLIELMPFTMRAEIYYDVNKFVLDQLPLLANLEEAFLMNVSVYMKHNFYLRGEVLQQRNQNGSAMFYIINGHLEIMHEDERSVMAEIRSGSAIGELYLLQSYSTVATVRCGTECDIMVLRKEDFKNVLQMYPDYLATLQKRIDARLEQSGLLLALCEKHNEYPSALKKLQQFREPDRDPYFRNNYDVVTSVLDPNTLEEVPQTIRTSDDYDGLDIDPEIRSKLARGSIVEKEKENIRRVSAKEAMAAVCTAIENDIMRASSLAKDLNILRPPLTVKAPSLYQTARGSGMKDKQPLAKMLIPKIFDTVSEKPGVFLFWKLFTFGCIFVDVWYFTFQFAFQKAQYHHWDYITHVFDVVFLLDFILDLNKAIVLPHKTLESRREILRHRSKTVYFYIRIFSFLPIEYVLGPILGWNYQTPFYYLLKFNRLIQLKEVLAISGIFENTHRIGPEFLYIFRFSIRLFFTIHFFAIIFEVVIRNLVKTHQANSTATYVAILDDKNGRNYEYVYYWATEVLTATGYGDFPLRDDYEIATTVIGVIIGTLMIIFMNARLAALIANRERRRVSFKQTYYSLLAFMKERQFIKSLSQRVKQYYQLQWRSHEGVLISTDKSAIWDVPKSLLFRVSLAQAQKYLSRIPLFMYCPENLISEICSAMKQYVIPPHETVLYPGDQTRELYIIVKGICTVSTRKGKTIGKLSEGNYFGINGLVYGKNKQYKIATVNYCQLFCLEFKNFADIAKKFPKFLFEYKLLRGDSPFPNYIETDINPADWEVFRKKLRIAGPINMDSTSSFISIGKESRLSVGHSEHIIDSEEEDIDDNFPPVKEPSRFAKFREFMKQFGTGLFWLTSAKTAFINQIIPYGKFLKCWTVLRVCSAFIVGNFALIQFVFSVDPTFALVYILIFDIIAWMDLYVCFRIGYYGEHNQLITARKKTALHYLKGPFVLDIIACFPVDLLIIIFNPAIAISGENRTYNNMYTLISGLRITRLLQCYRLFVSGNLLQKQIFRSLSFLILLQVVPLMCLFLNVTTCLSVLAVCGTSINGEPKVCPNDAWILKGTLYKNAPVAQNELMKDAVESYLIGFYWVITSALCVGFGDIDIIGNETNRKIAITVIFLGCVVTGYLVSKLTACLVGEDSRRIEIREKTNVMFRYLEQFRVPKDIRRRVKEYYYSSWDKTQGINPRDLFDALSPALKSDAMKALYEERLKTSPIFENLDQPGMRILSSNLQEMILPEGEFLFQYGDLNADVYFIAKGLIATYTERGDIISYVGFGSLIGEISCLFDIQRLFSAVAATDLEIYILKKEIFLDFLSLYPTIKQTLEEVCLRHYRETMENSANAIGLRVITTITEHPGESQDEEINNLVESIRDYPATQMEGMKTAGNASNEDTILTLESQQGLTMAEIELGSGKEVSKLEADKNADFIDDPLRRPVHHAFMSEYVTSKDKGSQRSTRKQWISFLITYGKVPRDEMGKLHIVQEKGKFNAYNMVFHPMSPICQSVSLFLFLTSLSCGLTAYEIAFSTDNEGETTNLMILRCLLEVFFVIRIFGNFHLGYYDEYGAIVYDIVKVIKRYLYSPGGFFLDVITTFPFYLLTYFHKEGGWRSAVLSADIRGLQLFRVFLFARYLKETETELRMKLSMVKLVKMTIMLCFIFHFCACAWYLVACDAMDCRDGSWMSILIRDMEDKSQIGAEQDFTIGSRYLLSLYYVVTAITFTGLSEITPRTQIEFLSTISMIFTTVFVIGFLVGEMTQCLASQVATKIHFRHRLNVMEHHFVSLGLKSSKIIMIRKYFRLLWLKCNGNMYSRILAELPYSLRADITMKVYGSNIKSSRLLGKLDETIIRQLSVRIKHEIYLPSAHIVRTGDVCSSVYFIKKGEVVIMDENANMNLCVDVLYEGECFGEVKVLLPREQFRFSYVARMETEIGLIAREDLVDVLSRHHGLLEDMLSKANKVKEQRLAAKDEEDRAGHNFGGSDSDINVSLFNRGVSGSDRKIM